MQNRGGLASPTASGSPGRGRIGGGVGAVDPLGAPTQTWPDPTNRFLHSSPIKILIIF